MSKDKALGYLGLAARSGNLTAGYNNCLSEIRNGKVYLVIISQDVGEASRQRITAKCGSRGIPVRIRGSAEELSRAAGKVDKGIFGIRDRGLAEALIKAMDGEEETEERKVF